MKRIHIFALASSLLATSLFAFAGNALAAPVTFKAADDVTVYADYQGDGTKPLILLFHQASSNRHEYDTIAPKLNALGFDTLAVDQRSGGSLFGGKNETAAGLRSGADFLAAYPDLEAALKWGANRAGASNARMIVWGSSYSASLVFMLAAKNPDKISAILSFSPGEYFGARFSVRDSAAKVKMPVFVSSASDSGEVNEAARILAAVPGATKTQLVPKSATHGSSALNPAQNPRGAEEVWRGVEVFLKGLK